MLPTVVLGGVFRIVPESAKKFVHYYLSRLSEAHSSGETSHNPSGTNPNQVLYKVRKE